ncbi:MAG: fatty acid--CoA ligase family protein [bacterium]|nr:fatty acid--CoA ligase family protein [bacterium]
MMLYHLLQQLCQEDGSRYAIIYQGKPFRYNDLLELVNGFMVPWQSLRGVRVGIQYTHPIAHLGWLIALHQIGAHIFLLGNRKDTEIVELQKRFGIATVFPFHDTDAEAQIQTHTSQDSFGYITLLTSGTTGIPKAATHTIESLTKPVRKDPSLRDTVWFFPYPPYLYAGLQVTFQALLNGSTLVVPESLSPLEAAQCFIQNRVTHATGTPTFWRQVLLFAPKTILEQCSFQQITLGGETVPQDILDGLKKHFPKARISHIYASSELGRLFSVNDGRAGFPTKWLEQAPEEGIALKVVNHQLFARSKNAMTRYEDRQLPTDEEGWVATGDLVRIEGERVYFEGRESDIINVGGAKVSPLQVENCLLAVEGVAQVRVYGKSSSVVGQLVCADVVPHQGVDPAQLKKKILQFARETLEPHCIPRVIQFVNTIEINESGKTVRKGQ